MRKIKLLSFLTISLVFAIFSCTNESSEITNNTVSDKINAEKLEFVGIEHNIILGEVFEYLKKETSDKSYVKKSAIDKRKSLEVFLISQVNDNKKYSEHSKEIAIKSMENLFKEKQTNSKSSTYSKNAASSLSDIEKQYLDELNDILNKIDLEKDISNVEQDIITLEKHIEDDDSLSSEQLTTLFSATQTAKYSHNYWNENWEKWINLDSNESSKWSNLKHKEANDGHNGCACEAVGNVAKADVAGAAGGAAYALAVNVVPGAGQVAYAGAIVGTAAAGSAIAAVYEFFNW